MEKIISLVGIVHAEDINIQPTGKFENLGGLSIPGIISAGIQAILIIAALVAFIFLVYGGIKWITSSGDKEATAKAQGTLTAAIIGLAIVFAAWAIMKLMQTFFGIGDIFNLTIPIAK